MNRFDGVRHWAWSILVVTALAFALGGCSDGKDGERLDPRDLPGPPGPEGACCTKSLDDIDSGTY